MAAFFSRLAYKPTAEWKEEIVLPDPASTDTLTAVFPDGAAVRIAPDQDPREVFADWLVAPNNPWFARNAANRVWAWLMGRGIIHEPDDIRSDSVRSDNVRPDNPPANPELVAFLEKELVKAHYDLRHLYRLILNSRTYQQSSIPQGKQPDAEALFAFYPVRRLDAEVLIDALCAVTGTGEGYSSPIPEPYTFIPENQRTIALADGSISSPFLETFGRPTRDSGLESERNNQPTEAQRLYLFNASDVQRRITQGPRLHGLMQASKGNPEVLIRWTYLAILSRFPTPNELATAKKYFQTSGRAAFTQAEQDLAWALINSKEFLYRH
jgi:hypothetical protein